MQGANLALRETEGKRQTHGSTQGSPEVAPLAPLYLCRTVWHRVPPCSTPHWTRGREAQKGVIGGDPDREVKTREAVEYSLEGAGPQPELASALTK